MEHASQHPKVEFLICGSPNDAFYSQIAFFRLALDSFGERWKQARVVAVFGDENPPPLPDRWKAYFKNIEVVYADPEEFRRTGFYAASDLRFELVDPDSDLSCICDADTAFIRPLPQDLLDEIKASPAVMGVIVHIPFSMGGRADELFPLQNEKGGEAEVQRLPADTPPHEAWEKLGHAILGRSPDMSYRYNLLEPPSTERSPFYINYGFLAAPPQLMRELYRGIREVEPKVISMVGNGFYGQVTITMAAEKLNLPVRALPMRFNYPNDRKADRLHPDEMRNMVLCHYLRHSRFNRHHIFTSPKAFNDFLGRYLIGSDRVFQVYVNEITGGRYPFAESKENMVTEGAEVRHPGGQRRSIGVDWQRYYQDYPLQFDTSEYLKQTGHTLQGKPISQEQFDLILGDMRKHLALERDDALLDLCCGNGIFTRELAKKCRHVAAVDFSEPLLNVAERDHIAPNLHYYLMDVSKIQADSAFTATPFSKVVMCAALQYFDKTQLDHLLGTLKQITEDGRRIVFLLIPDKRKKWAFYKTFSQRIRHLYRLVRGAEVMGTWWDPRDIESVCSKHGLKCTFYQMDERLHPSQYRFHVVIS